MPSNHDLPEQGEWPCQRPPMEDPENERLVAFLYRLVRDGAKSPGDVEQHALAVRNYHPFTDGAVAYTNSHLEAYARSMASFLLPR